MKFVFFKNNFIKTTNTNNSNSITKPIGCINFCEL